MVMRLFLAVFLTYVGLHQAAAEDFAGKVLQVSRGDALTVSVGRKHLRIRLAEVIVPKLGQPFNNRSRRSLSEMCLGKSFYFYGTGASRDGAPAGHLWCDGMYANAEQVRRGMAWVVARFAGRRSPFTKLQTEARARKAGLWADNASAPVSRTGKVPLAARSGGLVGS